jgi:hypothetical protein
MALAMSGPVRLSSRAMTSKVASASTSAMSLAARGREDMSSRTNTFRGQEQEMNVQPRGPPLVLLTRCASVATRQVNLPKRKNLPLPTPQPSGLSSGACPHQERPCDATRVCLQGNVQCHSEASSLPPMPLQLLRAQLFWSLWDIAPPPGPNRVTPHGEGPTPWT